LDRTAAVVALLLFPALSPRPVNAADILYVSLPGRVLVLVDDNADGDYLDFAEQRVYVDALRADLGALFARGDDRFLLDAATSTILRLRDLNSDGDCLDFAETVPWAQPPGPAPAPLIGLAGLPAGPLFSADPGAGEIYRFEDLNADGDAFDAGEALVVAAGLTAPTALDARPDGRLLVAVGETAVPVRILHDRNADGDFLDFAENLSYAENAAPGLDLASPADRIAFLARPADGIVLKLHDLTADGDALDFAEVTPFAPALPAASFIAAAGPGRIYVLAADPAGTLYRLEDLNGDGDAADAGEILLVADGLAPAAGLALAPPAQDCVAGDLNADGAVELSDVPLMAAALLGLGPPPLLCRADLAPDGLIDARDLRAFIALLAP
jgi:hypothetical protein